MLRLLIGGLITGSLVFASGFDKAPKSIDDKITNFFLSVIDGRDGAFRIKEISVRGNKDVKDIPGWKVYFVDIKIEMLRGKKEDMTVHEKVFTNGKYIAKDFLDIDSHTSLKNLISVDIKDNSIYNKKHLIYGSGNESHKLVAISDPLCPFCQDFMPGFLEAIKKHPGKVALYYYHLPLGRIHPASPTVSRLMLVAKKKGVADVELYTYKNKDYFKYDEKDEDKIIRAFNKVMGTDIKKEELYTKEIDDELKEDKKYIDELMVNGTPTIYVDGKKDNGRQKYKKILGIK
jgi:predicted DsbA family dithiol-disulfide isomerase